MISIGLAASGLSAYSAAILSMIRILQMLRKPSVERPDVALLFVDYVFDETVRRFFKSGIEGRG